MKIIGSYVSPYVRKVLACLALKDLAYEIDPITPFYGNEEFGRLSPLRRIPVLIDGDLTLCDSTVICAYLDEAYPGTPLLPAAPADRARARWFEEYADTRLGDLFIWGLFYQKVVHPIVWGEPGDQARIDRTLNEDLPRELDYLERELPAEGWLFGDLRPRRHRARHLLPQRRLCRLRGRRRALAANGRLRRPRARPFRLRHIACLRGRAARDDSAEAARGAGRCRRAAERGDTVGERTSPGRHGALSN